MCHRRDEVLSESFNPVWLYVHFHVFLMWLRIPFSEFSFVVFCFFVLDVQVSVCYSLDCLVVRRSP